LNDSLPKQRARPDESLNTQKKKKRQFRIGFHVKKLNGNPFFKDAGQAATANRRRSAEK
jgi:hypothetical protein